MAYYIALDAGGTKTETIVHDETGHILCRLLTKGCNAMDLGVAETQRRAVDAIRSAAARIPGGTPARVYAGIASVMYYGDLLTKGLNEALSGMNVRWEDDGPEMISSVLGVEDGCCIVCGTGCSLFARAQGEIHHIGGWGYLVDTWGSGYVLGREALRAALRQSDGRGKKTVLYDLVSRQLGKPVEQCVPVIYEGGRPFIASFAHTIFEGRGQGDAECSRIFEEGSAALAEMTYAAEPYFAQTFPVVMSGGIFAAFPEYAQRVREKGSARAQLIRADVPPVLGGAVENAWADGMRDMPAFRARFMADYTRLKNA